MCSGRAFRSASTVAGSAVPTIAKRERAVLPPASTRFGEGKAAPIVVLVRADEAFRVDDRVEEPEADALAEKRLGELRGSA